MLKALESKTSQGANVLKERNVKHLRVEDTKALYEVYDFKEEIGHGSFGIVVLAIEKKTLKDYAIKIVNKFTTSASKLQECQRELKILKLVDHPNVVHLERVYETNRKIYMVLERCFLTLHELFKKKCSLTEKVSRKIIKQLVSAINYLHKYDIVHRDVKMENILILNKPDESDEYIIKLCDFGLGIIKSGTGVENLLTEYCGTFIYMAPEILMQHAYSQLCDVWAVGIILYTILYGVYPFFSTDEEELRDLICDSEPFYPSDNVSREVIDLIKSILKKDPVTRITALEIMKHPWFLENKVFYRKDENVIEYMKKWKSEMMTPKAEDTGSDWISYALDLDTSLNDINASESTKKIESIRKKDAIGRDPKNKT